MQSWVYQARANEPISTCNTGSKPPLNILQWSRNRGGGGGPGGPLAPPIIQQVGPGPRLHVIVYIILYHADYYITLTPPLPIHLAPPNPKLVPTPLFCVEFWAAFNLLTDRSMFFDVKQLPYLKSGSCIYVGAVKRLRNSLSSCGNTSQNEQ